MTNIIENFTETQYKSIPGQISTNESLGIVECFAAAIGNKDSVGDICLPGCFDASLRRRKPRVVWGHSWNEPIGKVLDIYEVGPNDPRLPPKMRVNKVGGLYARVQINLKSERGKEAFSNIQFFGEEQEWSIGYKTLDATFDNEKKANLLKEVELYEVSPVLHGANQLTGTISVKSDESTKAAGAGPCWPGYQQIGMKKGKNGNMVPDCVPANSTTAKSALKDPKGGLTAAGRAHFKKIEGANLKPGVRGAADTPQKMRRKGSFLTRFFTNPSGPMTDDSGKPTRLALSAAAWGEPIPKNMDDAAKLAAKGRRFLEKYNNSKTKSQEQTEMKNMPIYSQGSYSANPAVGRMGGLARHLSMHFGGQVAVREADENTVIFDLEKDNSTTTMRAGWHTPDGERFMFGSASAVKPETVYIPVGDGPAFGMPGEPQQNFYGTDSMYKPDENSSDMHSDCGCGGKGGSSCGAGKSAIKSWSLFKDETPGLHMFVKTQNVEMYEAANEIGNSHGFDVELLADGFAVPNMDWYGADAQNALINALETISEKAAGRSARRAIGRGRNAGKLKLRDGVSFDGDGDGNITNPRTGRDDMPFVKPNVPKMPAVPEEIPQEVPEKIPIKVPRRPSVPSPVKVPKPSRPVPANSSSRSNEITGAMRASSPKNILSQFRELGNDLANPSGMPRRARDLAIARIAKQNNISEEKVRQKLRAAITREGKNPKNIINQLRELERDASNPSGSPRRAMDLAIARIAKQNNISEKKVRQKLRQAIARERASSILSRVAKARGKSELSVYVSISENYDLEIKSGMHIPSTDIDTFQIDIHPPFIYEVKSAVDEIARYHGFRSFANDGGLQIKGIASVGRDAIGALVNAVLEIEKRQSIEIYEIDKFSK